VYTKRYILTNIGGKMKQKRGKDYKMTRQWTDQVRKSRKPLLENIKRWFIREEFQNGRKSNLLVEEKE